MKTQESRNPNAPPKSNHLNSTSQQFSTLDNLTEMLTADMISQYLQVNYGKALQLIKFGGIPISSLAIHIVYPRLSFSSGSMKLAVPAMYPNK